MQLLEVSRVILCASIFFAGIQTCLASSACDALNNIEGCVVSNHARAEVALNGQYKKSISSLSGSFKDNLKSVEISWLDYRRDTCGSLNQLDSLGCESSLSDQRTQELYLIDRRIGVGIAYGVVDFISKEFGGGSDNSLLAMMLVKQPQSESWSSYSEKHCRMMNELVGEKIELCKIRLILNNWEGF